MQTRTTRDAPAVCLARKSLRTPYAYTAHLTIGAQMTLGLAPILLVKAPRARPCRRNASGKSSPGEAIVNKRVTLQLAGAGQPGKKMNVEADERTNPRLCAWPGSEGRLKAWVNAHAVALGLRGFVRNRTDGSWKPCFPGTRTCCADR